MEKHSCCLLLVLLVLALSDVTTSKTVCGSGLKGRKGPCRNVFSMFKRLLENMDEEQVDDGNVDEEREVPLGTETDEEAALRALLYGQAPDDDPLATEERISPEGEEDPSDYRQVEKRRYELEMDLVEELLRDLENFNKDGTTE